MANYARSISFDILNESSTRSWAEVYAYESLLSPGALTFEITLAAYGSNNGSSVKSFRLFLNTLQQLNQSKSLTFEGLSPSRAGNRGYQYVFDYSGNSTTIVFTIKSSDGSALKLEDVVSISTGRGNTPTVLPFAPDALDDSFDLFEDGASDLDEPLAEAKPVRLDVLQNDTDANGYKLYISEIIEGPSDGSVTIGDADNDGYGDHLLFTPVSDLAFNTTIKYYVNNFNGGTDYATSSINVAAVADKPFLSTEVFAGVNANQTIIRVYATPVDIDGSEAITGIVLTGEIPANVKVLESVLVKDISGSWYRDFTITTEGPENLDLIFEATSTESSNNDQETSRISQSIIIFGQEDVLSRNFTATDQNMWATGDAYTFGWSETFTILDLNYRSVDENFLAEWDFDVQLYLGLAPYIYLDAGSIDADSLFTVTWEQVYNESTDQLQITPFATLDDAAFQTIFANGTFGLDLVYNYYIDALVDNGSLEDNRSDNLLNVFLDSRGFQKVNLFEFSTDDLEVEFDIPETPLTITVAWPQLEIASDPFIQGGSSVEGTDFSNNFFNLNVDVIGLILDVIKYSTGVTIPSEIFGAEFDGFSYNLLGIDLGFGFNVDQFFELSFDGLSGQISFLDKDLTDLISTTYDFVTGQTLVFDDAMSRFGNADGLIEYDFTASPVADLTNETGMGINFNGELSGPGFNILGVFEWELFDPLEFSENVAVIPIWNDTFDFQFESTDPFGLTAPSGSTQVVA